MIGNRLCVVCNHIDTKYLDQLKRIKEWFYSSGIRKFDNKALNLCSKLRLQGAFRHNIYCKYGISGCDKITRVNSEQNALAKEVCYLLLTYIHNGDFSKVHILLRLLQGYFPREYKVLEKEWHKQKKSEEE